MESAERSTSASVVDQFAIEIRIACLPCHTVPPAQQVLKPSRLARDRLPVYYSYMKQRPQAASVDLIALLHTANVAQAEVESKLSALGLSLPKLFALKALSDAGESMPLSQLAERLSCVKSNVTQLVDRLEADGFVTRRSAPGDRRTRLAVLTAAGRKAYTDGSRVQKHTEQQLLGALSKEEAEQLAALLEKIAHPKA